MNRRDLLKSLSVLPAVFAPASIPSNRRSRLVSIVGNSLSSMGNGVASWPQYLAEHLWMRAANFGIVDISVGGATIVDVFQRASLVNSLAGLADENYVLLWESTNTMHKFGGDVSGTYWRHREYCDLCRAQGFKVLVGTGISRNDMPVYGVPTNFSHAQMCDLNETMRRTCHEFADGIIDFAAIPELGNEGACDNRQYFWDSIHLTKDGYFLVRDAVLSALQARVNTYYLPAIGAGSLN